MIIAKTYFDLSALPDFNLFFIPMSNENPTRRTNKELPLRLEKNRRVWGSEI